MNKKLPNIYTKMVEKKFNNNKTVFYSFHKEKEKSDKKEKKALPSEVNINKRIKDMFNSPNFIYKINAKVTLKDGNELNKDIIGQINRKLITIDDDFINIDEIEDINF